MTSTIIDILQQHEVTLFQHFVGPYIHYEKNKENRQSRAEHDVKNDLIHLIHKIFLLLEEDNQSEEITNTT